jgi:hypothetical protein
MVTPPKDEDNGGPRWLGLDDLLALGVDPLDVEELLRATPHTGRDCQAVVEAEALEDLHAREEDAP